MNLLLRMGLSLLDLFLLFAILVALYGTVFIISAIWQRRKGRH